MASVVARREAGAMVREADPIGNVGYFVAASLATQPHASLHRFTPAKCY